MDIWDALTQGRLERVQEEVDAAVGSGSDSRLIELQRRMDRLVLATAAIAELLEERHGISKQELREKMREIDLRDGREDGRILSKPVKCRKCKRETHPRRGVCVYCGETLIDAPPVV